MAKSTITGEQVKAARMLLRWEQTDLASKTELALPTIRRIEMTRGEFIAHPTTISAIRRALEHAGIVFVCGHSRGVMLREKHGRSGTSSPRTVRAMAVGRPRPQSPKS